MSESGRQDGSGCAALIAVIVVIGAVVAGVVSIAALVDPFSWLPPIGEIFGDCQDGSDAPEDDCDLGTRFPGFWGHVVVNFAYAVAAAGLGVWLFAAVVELREARANRFAGLAAVGQYESARRTVAVAASLVGVLAAAPVVAAIA